MAFQLNLQIVEVVEYAIQEYQDTAFDKNRFTSFPVRIFKRVFVSR